MGVEGGVADFSDAAFDKVYDMRLESVATASLEDLQMQLRRELMVSYGPFFRAIRDSLSELEDKYQDRLEPEEVYFLLELEKWLERLEMGISIYKKYNDWASMKIKDLEAIDTLEDLDTYIQKHWQVLSSDITRLDAVMQKKQALEHRDRCVAPLKAIAKALLRRREVGLFGP